MIRTFVSVSIFDPLTVPEPPAAGKFRLSDRLAQATADLTSLGRSVKPVLTANFHVTLKFLGATDEAGLPDIIAAMKTVTRFQDPFDWLVQGVGVFPDRRRPSVVWAGVEPAGPFQELAAALNEILRPLGFEPELRSLTPHITLGRLKGRPPAGLDSWLDENQERRFGSGRVREIRLMRTDSTPSGPVYSLLALVKFGGLDRRH